MGILARPIGTHGARKNLNFVAPEVLQKGSERIGTKSDVWMLGCSVSAFLKSKKSIIITTSFRCIFY